MELPTALRSRESINLARSEDALDNYRSVVLRGATWDAMKKTGAGGSRKQPAPDSLVCPNVHPVITNFIVRQTT